MFPHLLQAALSMHHIQAASDPSVMQFRSSDRIPPGVAVFLVTKQNPAWTNRWYTVNSI